jgi:type VI secretion system protein ImpK
MSNNNRPANPFGRGDRTIIRPNPGGRLPPAPPQSYADPTPVSHAPFPAAAGFQPVGLPPTNLPTPPPVAVPVPPATYASPPATLPTEDWISTPVQPVPAPTPARRAPNLRVDELVAPNANPIMRAAGPLLQLLGRLRVALLRAPFASLMGQVAEAIEFFEKDIRSAGISEQQANNAKYVLCATADDIVQHIPTDDRHIWTQYSMLSRFFGERIGGVRFFEILEHTKLDPLVNYPLLELQHACLALGFQGQYRASPGGQVTLGQIQRNVYETLRRVRPKAARDLSPRWQGQALAAIGNRLRVPAWVVTAVAAALLFALFVILRILLSGDAGNAAATTMALHDAGMVEIKRRVIAPPPPPPPPPPQPPRIDACVDTIPTPNKIVLRLCDSITFEPGQAIVKEAFKPVAAKIVAYLNERPGRIKVVGHTDSIPIKNVRFPSNWHLSVERANAVAALIKSGLSDPGRIEVDGKGSDVPIARNDTAEGRAKNRRVEVMIARNP